MGDTHYLIEQCLQGNAKAQKALYEEYAEFMLGVCFRYTRSLTEAEDILQEGFVRVFKSLHQFKGAGDLGAWIRKIMVNTALNELRKSKLDVISQDIVPVESIHHVENDVEYQLTAKEIAILIQKLPDGYRIIFNMHATEGYSYKEISEMMNVKEVTVRSQYLRARAQLIRYIKSAEIERNKPVENG